MSKELLILGFKKYDGCFEYKFRDGYIINVNLVDEQLRIDYGDKITLHHRGITNLDKPENLVVLECVIRLIKKGYKPQNIELEKTWPLGHKQKGRLDILLKDIYGSTYAMIECKTWGIEYSNERNKMLEDGGQLFSYFVQERNTKALYLYSSKIDEDIKIKAEYIDSSFFKGSNIDEIFREWDGSFIPNGIFNEDVGLYEDIYINILKKRLEELDDESTKILYSGFKEIIRRHSISDQSNAFNKIFNLFVCKIIDEDITREDEETAFQWKKDDTYESLLSRLKVLYKIGLEKYLEIEIDPRFENTLNEFLFIDVFDETTYQKNMCIVKEVIELLQTYQLKYSKKQQFLGDFFEGLLNTGIKQEAGQYFTPVPLARFIIRSLPINQIVNEKIVKGEVDILPYVIDYACGSGHFLTEVMDEIQQTVEFIDEDKLVGRSKSRFASTKKDYIWAKEYIYGIEKDYRLAKTTKIATFLHGDGDAKIINGDGLDDFYYSNTYYGLLKSNTKTKTNNKFDVVISNPPYSISNFKKYIVDGENNFSLYNKITFDSTEIECLFLERASQLLKSPGYGGLIFPLSLLNNTKNVYRFTRKKLLIDFEVIGLCEFGNKTFVATPTSTVCIFLKKRDENTVNNLINRVYEYFVNGKNRELAEKINLYLDEREQNFKELKDIFRKDKYFNQNNIDLVELDDRIINLITYLLNLNKKTVISFSGNTVSEQQFYLGYRIATGNKNEGIYYYKDEQGIIQTQMYNENIYDDNSKVSSFIRNNYLGEELSISESLSSYVRYVDTLDLISSELIISNPSQFFMQDNKDMVYSYSKHGDFIDEFQSIELTLGDLVDRNKVSITSGIVYDKSDEVPYETNNKILTATNIDLLESLLIYPKLRYLKDSINISNSINPKKDDIIICTSSGSLKHLGKVAYVYEDLDNEYIGGFLSLIRSIEGDLSKVIFYNLLSKRFRAFIVQLRDQNINNLTPNQLKSFVIKIPVDIEKFNLVCKNINNK